MGLTLSARQTRFNSYRSLARNLITPISEIDLVKVDETSAYLMYKNFERKQNENRDECLKLGCYEHQ